MAQTGTLPPPRSVGSTGPPDLRTAAASAALTGLLGGPDRPVRVVAGSARGCYLELDGAPGIIGVLTAGSVRLPIALLLPPGTPAPAAPVGSVGRVGGGVVQIGGRALRVTRWWDPLPHPGQVSVAAVRVGCARLAARLGSGAATRFGLSPTDSAVTALAMALGGMDPVGLDAAAGGLLGRGPGLTPAGDDVVAGALAALRVLGGDPSVVTGWAQAIRRRARTATTPLSAALLGCAGRGEVIPEARALLEVVAGGGGGSGTCALDDALAALLTVGSTSGSDLALGVLLGARAAGSIR